MNSLKKYKPRQDKEGTEGKNIQLSFNLVSYQMTDKEDIEKERAQLKKYIMSSIIEEE